MKKVDLEKIAQEIISDENQARWEDRSLGNDAAHIEVSTKTTIRLPNSMIASLKAIAADQGMPYQTYIKHVLHVHVQERLKKR